MYEHEIFLWLNSLRKVIDFHYLVCDFDEDIKVCSGKYLVDPKDFMSLCTVDISCVVPVIIYAENRERAEWIERRFNALKQEHSV